MQDKIKNSTYAGTASDIRGKLQQAGYLVSADTLKSWAHRGKLKPVRKDGKHPIYKLSDVYNLMTQSKPVDNVWNLIGGAE